VTRVVSGLAAPELAGVRTCSACRHGTTTALSGCCRRERRPAPTVCRADGRTPPRDDDAGDRGPHDDEVEVRPGTGVDVEESSSIPYHLMFTLWPACGPELKMPSEAAVTADGCSSMSKIREAIHSPACPIWQGQPMSCAIFAPASFFAGRAVPGRESRRPPQLLVPRRRRDADAVHSQRAPQSTRRPGAARGREGQAGPRWSAGSAEWTVRCDPMRPRRGPLARDSRGRMVVVRSLFGAPFAGRVGAHPALLRLDAPARAAVSTSRGSA
jgi:hypothetical protein